MITEETLIWTEGMEGWEPFEEAKHLFAWPGSDDEDEDD